MLSSRNGARVYDRSYRVEPEDMVLKPEPRGYGSHKILLSAPVTIGLWVLDWFGFGTGIGSRGTGIGLTIF